LKSITPYTILLAEDDTDDQYFLQLAVKDIDPLINLEIVTDGLSGMNYFSGSDETKANLPKFIITDLNMPRLNGFEFIMRLKQSVALKNIPVFVLSTCEDKDSRLNAIEAGASGYYVKPIDLTELGPIIKSMIRNAC
jgi:CheY-like chemotaxis protein